MIHAPKTFVCCLLLALATGACSADPNDDPIDVDPETAHPNARADAIPVELTLETRAGTSREGWSFAEESLVVADQANLTVSSSDCGARGRWVQLQASGVTLCHDDDGSCTPKAELAIGGSDPEVAIGERIAVHRDGELLGDLFLVGRTPTPFAWYENADDPFVVQLDFTGQ